MRVAYRLNRVPIGSRRSSDPSRATSVSDSQLNRVFQALTGETRREILKLLEGQSLCVNDIVEQFDLAQPTISKHLSVLREAGLVRNERRGQQVFYRTDLSAISEVLMGFLSQLRGTRYGAEETLLDSAEPGSRRVRETRISSF